MKTAARIAACAVLLGSFFITAGTARAYPADGYEITSYDVQAVVGENNVYDITETICVHFTEQRHGIYRAIPINTVMSRTSGGRLYETRVQSWITDIRVEGCEYSVSQKGGLVSVRIGSEDTLLTGDQTYRISYKLHFGDDGVAAFDEAYYNINGNDWTSTTGVLTFSVTLPSGFDAEKLGFSIGYKGTEGYDPADLSFSVRGNTISGRVLRPLSAGEGVTMRLELPEGYFAPETYVPDRILVGVLALPVIAATVLFLLYGPNKRPVKTVEFFPPENLTSAELGYVHSGYPHARDVISLIIYWADQGYLSIRPAGKGFLLTKLKPIGENAKDYERYMFGRIFKKGDEVKTQSLKNRFYGTINKVTKMIGKAYASDGQELFTKQSVKVRPLISLLSVLPITVTMLVAMIRSLGAAGIIAGLLYSSLLLAPMIWLINLLRHWRQKSRTKRVISLAVTLLIWAALFALHMPLVIATRPRPRCRSPWWHIRRYWRWRRHSYASARRAAWSCWARPWALRNSSSALSAAALWRSSSNIRTISTASCPMPTCWASPTDGQGILKISPCPNPTGIPTTSIRARAPISRLRCSFRASTAP